MDLLPASVELGNASCDPQINNNCAQPNSLDTNPPPQQLSPNPPFTANLIQASNDANTNHIQGANGDSTNVPGVSNDIPIKPLHVFNGAATYPDPFDTFDSTSSANIGPGKAFLLAQTDPQTNIKHATLDCNLAAKYSKYCLDKGNECYDALLACKTENP